MTILHPLIFNKCFQIFYRENNKLKTFRLNKQKLNKMKFK